MECGPNSCACMMAAIETDRKNVNCDISADLLNGPCQDMATFGTDTTSMYRPFLNVLGLCVKYVT